MIVMVMTMNMIVISNIGREENQLSWRSDVLVIVCGEEISIHASFKVTIPGCRWFQSDNCHEKMKLSIKLLFIYDKMCGRRGL